MFVGVCRLVLHLPEIRTLKGKRKIVRKFCERLKNRYPISISEVGSQNNYKKSEIGIAFVTSNYQIAKKILDELYSTAESLHPLIEKQTEIIQYSQHHPPENTYPTEIISTQDRIQSDSSKELPEFQPDDPWEYLNSWKKN